MSYIIAIVVYILAMLVIGFVSYRKEGERGYFLAGGRLGPWLVSVSFFATYFSTSALLGGGGSGYIFGFGWSAYLTMFHVLFAVLSWIVVAPKLKEFVEEKGILTIPEFFRVRYDSKALQVISSLVVIVFFSFYMISIYKGASNLLQVMMGIPYKYGVFLVAIPVILYTSIGGFRAVVLTDFVQGMILLFGALSLFGALVYKMGGLSAGLEALSKITLPGGVSGKALMTLGGYGPPPIVKSGMMVPFLLSLTFAISIAQLSSPQLIIRFYAARDKEVIRKGMLLTPILIGLFAVTVFSIGPFAHLFVQGVKDPDLVIPMLAQKIFPEAFASLILVAALAAAMSTINSNLMVLASSLVKDILGSKSVKFARISVIFLGLISPILALNPPGIIVTIIGSAFSVITSTFLVPLLAGLYSKNPSRLGAVFSMVGAVATCMIWEAFFYRKFFIYSVVPGLIVSFVCYYVGALIASPVEKEKEAGSPTST
ncbi:MAG: sodium/solute symporter [Synergistetes bacterium]|nr:sodium/solute symporter [Synergistota bacterium]